MKTVKPMTKDAKRIRELEASMKFIEWGLNEILRYSHPPEHVVPCLKQLRDEARDQQKIKTAQRPR